MFMWHQWQWQQNEMNYKHTLGSIQNLVWYLSNKVWSDTNNMIHDIPIPLPSQDDLCYQILDTSKNKRQLLSILKLEANTNNVQLCPLTQSFIYTSNLAAFFKLRTIFMTMIKRQRQLKWQMRRCGLSSTPPSASWSTTPSSTTTTTPTSASTTCN